MVGRGGFGEGVEISFRAPGFILVVVIVISRLVYCLVFLLQNPALYYYTCLYFVSLYPKGNSR